MANSLPLCWLCVKARARASQSGDWAASLAEWPSGGLIPGTIFACLRKQNLQLHQLCVGGASQQVAGKGAKASGWQLISGAELSCGASSGKEMGK